LFNDVHHPNKTNKNNTTTTTTTTATGQRGLSRRGGDVVVWPPRGIAAIDGGRVDVWVSSVVCCLWI